MSVGYNISVANRPPFAIGEWYHCYSRGTDKRKIFGTAKEYERFIALLYTSNGTNPSRISDKRRTGLYSILADRLIDRGRPLVEIGAYALMPTHVHFIIREIEKGGIARFMQKVFTGYTMYFNLKHARTGALFGGTFKSKHVVDDRYLKQLVSYVLLNPVELFEPGWKEGRGNIRVVERKVLGYPYSSLIDFVGVRRPENSIVNTNWDDYFDSKPRISYLLTEAQAYYQEHRPEV